MCKFTEIISNLYISCVVCAEDKELLLSKGITHIVNASQFKNPFPMNLPTLK